MSTAVIFGGSGFIGLHFARHLLDEGDFNQIFLADIRKPSEHAAHQFISADLHSGRVKYINCDVRNKIPPDFIGAGISPTLIANFAAVHREPGHASHEYYETNIPGAENVCTYADEVGCKGIIFTSSISPYGPSENARSELDIPTPETAYGGSKLVVEWIHRCWAAKDNSTDVQNIKNLLIVRPGVVFGPGEGGNVSRLVKMLTKGFFVYAANENTRKAGIYVKELCNAMLWAFNRNIGRGEVALFNMTMDPSPTMKDYVESVKLVLKREAFVPSIPRWFLLLSARCIGFCFTILGLTTSINIVRVRKLIRSNHIVPNALLQSGYRYRFDLVSAMNDWRLAMPSEWRSNDDSNDLRNGLPQV